MGVAPGQSSRPVNGIFQMLASLNCAEYTRRPVRETLMAVACSPNGRSSGGPYRLRPRLRERDPVQTRQPEMTLH